MNPKAKKMTCTISVPARVWIGQGDYVQKRALYAMQRWCKMGTCEGISPLHGLVWGGGKMRGSEGRENAFGVFLSGHTWCIVFPCFSVISKQGVGRHSCLVTEECSSFHMHPNFSMHMVLKLANKTVLKSSGFILSYITCIEKNSWKFQ